MAMPVSMILVMYVILCILSYDFNKLTMLYIHVHISISMTNKHGLTFFLSIKYLSVICKRCSFECDMGKYSTRPMNKVRAFRRKFCVVFSHIARKMSNVCIFSHDQVTHDITVIDCSANKLQLECDMG